jgi:hypothetical protein
MTDEHIKQLVERRIRQSEDITERVFNALRALENPSLPKDIKKYLDDHDDVTQKEELQRNYGGISNEIKRSVNHLLKKEEEQDGMLLLPPKKRRTITMRTILRKLKKLTQEGRINHVNNRYSVKDELKSDIRTFASQFGRSTLSEMMRRDYYPSRNTLEQNTEELIKAFGVYLVYCFAQAAKPVNVSNGNTAGIDKYGDKSQTSDKLASFWVQNVISPLNMYDYFLAVINNQQRQNHMEHKKPFYELNSETIEKILNVLEKKYPDYYKPLLETSSFFVKGPKESAAIEHMRRRKRKGK